MTTTERGAVAPLDCCNLLTIYVVAQLPSYVRSAVGADRPCRVHSQMCVLDA